jgi:hypothetical protein
MESNSSQQTPPTWRDLYIAALFENEKPRIAQRIAEAQLAILVRRRALTLSINDVRERHALDSALFSLEALRTCLAIVPPTATGNLHHPAAAA